MDQSITARVAEGISPFPNNRIRRITFEYSPGQILVLEGDAVTAWWGEYMHMFMIMKQIQESGPVVPSEMMQGTFDDDNTQD